MPESKTFASQDRTTKAKISKDNNGTISLTVTTDNGTDGDFAWPRQRNITVDPDNHVYVQERAQPKDEYKKKYYGTDNIARADDVVDAKLAQEIRAAYETFKQHDVKDGTEVGKISDFIDTEMKKVPHRKLGNEGMFKPR